MNSGIPSGEYKHTCPHSPSAPNSRSFSPAFTLVELLLVIVIIAILATITIVAFNGIQDRARASAVSAALNQASKKLELYSIDNGGYPATLSDAGVTDSNNVSYQYTASTAPSATYCTTATQGSTSYYISNTTKTPTKGGCPGHGQGGVAAITNLMMNPRGTSYSSSVGLRNSRWFGSSPGAGGYTLITNAADGPTGITTYARKTWTVAPGSIAGSGDTGYDITYTASASVAVGETYTFSCYVRPSVNRVFAIGLYTNAGRVGSSSQSGNANQWTRVSYTYTVPSGVTQITTWTCDSTASSPVNWGVGSTLDATGFMLTTGSTLYGYADGTSTNWVWNGAANASTSTGPAL